METPRQRLSRLGASALCDIELLSLVLGRGPKGEDARSLARRLVAAGGGPWRLAQTSLRELARLPGMGPAKAARLSAAFELGSRALAVPSSSSQPLCHSEMVFHRYGRPLAASRVERFWVVSVDAKNRPRAEWEVAKGGRMACQVDPAEIFRLLLGDSASGAIFVHNHPSGDPSPSAQDLAITRRLVAAGSLLDVRVLDHLIVGGTSYTSLRDAGLWPRID